MLLGLIDGGDAGVDAGGAVEVLVDVEVVELEPEPEPPPVPFPLALVVELDAVVEDELEAVVVD